MKLKDYLKLEDVANSSNGWFISPDDKLFEVGFEGHAFFVTTNERLKELVYNQLPNEWDLYHDKDPAALVDSAIRLGWTRVDLNNNYMMIIVGKGISYDKIESLVLEHFSWFKYKIHLLNWDGRLETITNIKEIVNEGLPKLRKARG